VVCVLEGYVDMCASVCVRAWAHVCPCVYVHVCICVYVGLHAGVCMCVINVCMYVYVYMCTYAIKDDHFHAHTHVCV